MLEGSVGVLLVNLGTPDSPTLRDVNRYLIEFLTDSRVIDFPWLKRQLLVRGLIVPARLKQSTKLYQKLWTDQGSPLLYHSVNLKKSLQESLGQNYKVALAMRYQNPSIEKGLKELVAHSVKSIIILPLFPQYASATTGSVQQKVMEIVSQWVNIPAMTFIDGFHQERDFIEALCERGRQYELASYDHILFSFHGLPERQIQKADLKGCCLKSNCCEKPSHSLCYRKQCYETAWAIAEGLNLTPDRYSVCFQSRLGKEPWIQLYASDVIHDCAKKGYRSLLVFSPSFVCDCLETISEIGEEYDLEFKKVGGKKLQLVEGLNDHPIFVKALHRLICSKNNA